MINGGFVMAVAQFYAKITWAVDASKSLNGVPTMVRSAE
jgi:hypothetical protein